MVDEAIQGVEKGVNRLLKPLFTDLLTISTQNLIEALQPLNLFQVHTVYTGVLHYFEAHFSHANSILTKEIG